MAETGAITALRSDERGPFMLAVLWPPIRCGCGRMASFVVWRGGAPTCTDCDGRPVPAPSGAVPSTPAVQRSTNQEEK